MAPFFERRLRKPEYVPMPEKVVKIATGYRHSLAITEKGSLFGWGYNNMQQLSNADMYADPDNPAHALFEPAKLGGELEGKFVVDAAAGEEHTIVVTQIRRQG